MKKKVQNTNRKMKEREVMMGEVSQERRAGEVIFKLRPKDKELS